MAKRISTFQLLLPCVILIVSDGVYIPGYYSWSYGERNDLFCPDKCKADETPDRCCSCEGKTCWDLSTTLCPTGKLSVEYLDIFGTSIILGPTNISFVELIHTNGLLTKIPDNICTWATQLVTLDLRRNRLTGVEIVKCLQNLDTLRLDYNMIEYIDNTTFTKMKNLRVLSVSHNLMQRLDPNVIIIEGGNIPIVDFSDNHNMDFLDLSNMFRPGPFCTLNFTNSYVEHLTNELGFVMEKVMHGPGDILLEHTHIGSFINFTSIGIEDLKEFGKYVAGKIRIDASSINCDCTLFPIVDSLGPEVGKYWQNVDGVDGQQFECYSPERMKGKNVTDMIETGDFGDLTCDLSEKPECPNYLCHCIDMPSEHKVLVNCTAMGFKSMPDIMPIGAWNNYKIDLILADNDISELPARSYYSRLVNLDLRQNNITLFTEGAAGNISSKLNFENQLLENIPPILQHKDPNLITFGPHPIVCDCSNTWIGDWIRLKHGHGRLNCSVNGEVIPAEDVSELTLNCEKFKPLPLAAIVSSSIGAITLLVVITGFCFLFRYEIMILKRMLSRKEFTEGVNTIDVFLSFNEDNDGVHIMARRYIKPALLAAGYTVFIPIEDILPGTQRDDEMAVAVDRSVNYVIVLCDKYAEDFDTMSELDTIWKSFQADKAKQIILINYDNLDSDEIKDDRLRAVRRTRCLDFKARDSELISRLMDKLGKPVSQEKPDDSKVDNVTSEDDPEFKEKIKMNNLGNEKEEFVKNEDLNLSVFDRLAMPKASECNCKYRKCYLHDDTLIQRPRQLTSNTKTVNVVPL